MCFCEKALESSACSPLPHPENARKRGHDCLLSSSGRSNIRKRHTVLHHFKDNGLPSSTTVSESPCNALLTMAYTTI